MPGLVKEFIEGLEVYQGVESNPDMGFVVQSGFPEPAHSRYVEKYLERLADRLNAKHLGTVVKGGVEGIQVMPGWMTRKLYNRFQQLGENFNTLGALDRRLIKKLAPREQLSRGRIILFKWMVKTGMANMYWNKNLKDNHAYDIRFASPYAPSRNAYMASLLQNVE